MIKLGKAFCLLVLFAVLLILCGSVEKVAAGLLTETEIFFSFKRKPYNEPVFFRIDCYGYTLSKEEVNLKQPGTYQPQKIYSFSSYCPYHGCRIYETPILIYKHVDYCSLYGETRGYKFKIEKFSNYPLQGCDEDLIHEKCKMNLEIQSLSENESFNFSLFERAIYFGGIFSEFLSHLSLK